MRYFIQAIFVALLTIFMIIQPSATISAAQLGLILWWQKVVPALLPFFIVSELLVRMQVIHYLGRWLDPLMRPLFNLPGAAGLAIAMGYTSGFPVGAVVTTKLWKEKLLTRRQASHLIAFTNNSSPLFIIGTIGVGMLHNQFCGYLLAGAHYSSNLLVGWYLGRKNRAASPEVTPIVKIEPPSGNLLGSSIRSSINNICQIGGFIIFFMVLTSFLNQLGLIDSIIAAVGWLVPNLPPSLVYGLSIGLIELTQGSGAVGAAQAPLLWQLITLSILLSFSGLCIQAQILSLVSEPGFAFRPYLAARFLQIPPAILITWLGYYLLAPVSTIAGNGTVNNTYSLAPSYLQWLALLLAMLVLSGAINLITYLFADLTHRARNEWIAYHLVKPVPSKLTSHQHTYWHHLRSLHLRFWPW